MTVLEREQLATMNAASIFRKAAPVRLRTERPTSKTTFEKNVANAAKDLLQRAEPNGDSFEFLVNRETDQLASARYRHDIYDHRGRRIASVGLATIHTKPQVAGTTLESYSTDNVIIAPVHESPAKLYTYALAVQFSCEGGVSLENERGQCAPFTQVRELNKAIQGYQRRVIAEATSDNGDRRTIAELQA